MSAKLLALKLTSQALHNRDFVPVLKHLCFAPDRVFAFNDHTAVVVDGVDYGLHCAVPGAVLLSVLNGCSEAWSLSTDKAEAVLKDKGMSVRFPTLEPDAFVFDPEQATPKKSFGRKFILEDTLVGALELLAVHSNTDGIRPSLTGVTMVAGGGAVFLYSTDNITITKAELKDGGGSKAKNVSCILPKDSCELIAKTYRQLAGEGLSSASLEISRDQVLAEFSCTVDEVELSVYVVAAAVKDEAVDYEKMLSSHTKGVKWFDCPHTLFDAARRTASLTSEDPSKEMVLESTASALSVAAAGALGKLAMLIKVKGGAELKKPYIVDPEKLLRAQPWAQEIGVGANALLLRGQLTGSAEVEGARIEYAIACKER